MIENKKLLVTVTVLAIIGVLSLLAYSTTFGPQSLKIGEIGTAQEGIVVLTQGTITDARPLSDGGASLILTDMNTSSSIGVYISPETMESWDGGNLIQGAVIEVQGTVSIYQESPEISVASSSDITMIAEAGTVEYQLGTVMRSIQLFDGMEVTTSGKMLDITVIQTNGTVIGTRFSLWQEFDNQSYSLECFCPERDLTAQHDEWDPVKVTGTISFYDNRGCWQMTVEIVAPV